MSRYHFAVLALCSSISQASLQSGTCSDSPADLGGGSLLQHALSTRTPIHIVEELPGVMQRIVSEPDLLDTALADLGLDTALSDIGLDRRTTVSFMQRANRQAQVPAPAPPPPATFLNGWNGNREVNKDNLGTNEVIAMAGSSFEQMGSIIGKFLTFQSVTPNDWLTLAQEVLVNAVNIALGLVMNMVSDIVAGFLSLAGSFFSGIIQAIFGWLQSLFEEPAPTTGELINSALAKERMMENKDMWNGLADEFATFPALFEKLDQHSESKTAWYLVMQHDLAVNKAKAFMKECLSEDTWDRDICKDYLKDGMWEVMVPYALTHMTVLWELIVQFMENPNLDISFRVKQVETLIERMKEVGTEYAAALRHAWHVVYPHRMSLIWNPFDQKYGSAGMTSSTVYHPFDFNFANLDRGADKLNLEYPMDADDSYGAAVGKIRDWAYEGCEGERHDDVRKDTNPKMPNHACNLLKFATGTDYCDCGAGNSQEMQWAQKQLSDLERECWQSCMSNYTAQQDKTMHDSFLREVEYIESMVQNLTIPETIKFSFQAEGKQCSAQSSIKPSRCVEALQKMDKPYSAVRHTTDEALPVGCSFTQDNTLVANDAVNGSGAWGYTPLCVAVLFMAHPTPEPTLPPPPPPTPAPEPTFTEVAQGKKCTSQKWLGPENTPIDCLHEVLSRKELSEPDGECSHEYFNYAKDGDGNCGCVQVTDCSEASGRRKTARKTRIYRISS